MAPGGTAGAGHAAPGTQEDLVQSAGDRIFFETDRNTLTPQATATLDRQSTWMQQYPQVNVWVAGNCDERGTEEYNLALGQRRAAADQRLSRRPWHQPRPHRDDQLRQVRPIDGASTPEAWAQNRNVITSVR